MTDNKANLQKNIAKIIRVLSVPPVMVTLLVLVLIWDRPEIFVKVSQSAVLITFLGLVPILAYPLQKLLPSLKNQGREAQRNLAFVLNFLGYGIAFFWALYTNTSREIKLICFTYFVTVVLMTICNKLIHFRASGHASSFTGPLVLLVYFVGVRMLLPCILVSVLIIWASVFLKRHTIKEIIGGIVVCLVSFVISYLMVKLMP
ncbi:MAG: hypothetical protein ACI4DW_07795 [Lachnospiraceae bacterium]